MKEFIVQVTEDIEFDPEGNVSLKSKIVGEIVRCKDCAIRYDSCPMVVRVGGYISFFTEDDDFCSRAQMKGEEE